MLPNHRDERVERRAGKRNKDVSIRSRLSPCVTDTLWIMEDIVLMAETA